MADQKLSFKTILQWDDEQCRDFLVSMRWSDGIRCPKCGSTEEPYFITRKSKTKNKVQSLYKCRSCRKQFTATTGTIFEDSKIPLNKWMAALYMMVCSKKGVSALQVKRMLWGENEGSYKTAWFMCHRIREAMREKGLLEPLSGDIEADETYLHPRRRRGSPSYHERVQDEIDMGIRPKPKRVGPYEGKPISIRDARAWWRCPYSARQGYDSQDATPNNQELDRFLKLTSDYRSTSRLPES